MTNKTRKWIRAGFEVLIHGGTAALIAGIVQHSFKDLGWFFLGNGGVRFLQWWANNPLPPDDDSSIKDSKGNPLVPTPTISINPMSKVQTMTVPTIEKKD